MGKIDFDSSIPRQSCLVDCFVILRCMKIVLFGTLCHLNEHNSN